MPQSAPSELCQRKVLLVDDLKINLDILAEALKDDYQIGIAFNGPKALEYAKRVRPDLILLDVMMPGMDGLEVCRKLKSNSITSSIPVILITSLDETRHKRRGFDFGAVDYISKPFDVVEVKARVKTHLTLKIARESLRNQDSILEQKVLERTRELEETQVEIVDRLVRAAEYRDLENSNQHIKRIGEFSRLLGKAVGLSPDEYNTLALSSIMHDVGKIGISDSILLKPGKLSEAEWRIMKTHPRIGTKLLAGSDSRVLQVAEIIASTHHEKWDGSGYPEGLAGENIPLEGRIACICDVFDALISERPYRSAWPVDKAMGEIRSGSGTHFDPNLVALFVSLEPEIRQIIDEHK